MDVETLTYFHDLTYSRGLDNKGTQRVDMSKPEFDTVEIKNKTKKKPKIEAPIVDFFKKLYGGVADVFKKAHESKKAKKNEGAAFKERAKVWGKTLTNETKLLYTAQLLPQLKAVLGIPSIKKIAEDKGLNAAVVEALKMGLIDAATLAVYFGILIPFVASGAAAAVNTALNNVPFLKPYITKIKEQEMAEEQNKAEDKEPVQTETVKNDEKVSNTEEIQPENLEK